MKEFKIYLQNGDIITVKAVRIIWYREAVVDMSFVDEEETIVAEFNSEHIAGYTVKEL